MMWKGGGECDVMVVKMLDAAHPGKGGAQRQQARPG